MTRQAVRNNDGLDQMLHHVDWSAAHVSREMLCKLIAVALERDSTDSVMTASVMLAIVAPVEGCTPADWHDNLGWLRKTLAIETPHQPAGTGRAE